MSTHLPPGAKTTEQLEVEAKIGALVAAVRISMADKPDGEVIVSLFTSQLALADEIGLEDAYQLASSAVAVLVMTLARQTDWTSSL